VARGCVANESSQRGTGTIDPSAVLGDVQLAGVEDGRGGLHARIGLLGGAGGIRPGRCALVGRRFHHGTSPVELRECRHGVRDMTNIPEPEEYVYTDECVFRLRTYMDIITF
jgi:hypothetical protein